MRNRAIATTLALLVLAWGFWPSRTKQVAQEAPSKRYLVGAHYFNRFPEGFEMEWPREPLLGRYSSWDMDVIEQHIGWASAHGIDFFSLSYSPSRPPEDLRLDLFLQAPSIEDIQFCIRYELGELSALAPKTASQQFLADMARLAATSLKHPRYLTIQGRPVLLLHNSLASLEDGAELLAQARKSFKAEGLEVYIVGDEVSWGEPREQRLRLFDAVTGTDLHDASRAEHQGHGASSNLFEDLLETYRRHAEATSGAVPVAPTVIPGFRDSISGQWRVDGEPSGLLGKLLRDFALPMSDRNAPLVFVNSWNDWNNDTAVEPYGSTAACLRRIREETCAVSGVLLSNDLPGEGIAVHAWRGQRLAATDIADSRGRYTLSRWNLAPGEYWVGTNREQATRCHVRPEDTVSLDLNTHQTPTVRSHALKLEALFPLLSQAHRKAREQFAAHRPESISTHDLKYYQGVESPRAAPPTLPRLGAGGCALIVGRAGADALLWAKSLARPTYCFVPNPDGYAALVHSAELSGVGELVVLPYALGRVTAVVHQPPAEQRALDSFGFQDVRLIVVEPAYIEALQGAPRLLRGSRPILFFPGGLGEDASLKAALQAQGYRLRSLESHDLGIPLTGNPNSFLVDAGKAGAQKYLKAGFSVQESDADTDFVWSDQASSQLAVPIEVLAPESYSLGVYGRTLSQLAPLQISVAVNGSPVSVLTFSEEWSWREIPIPNALLRKGENKIEFTYSQRGSGLAGGDNRQLALCLDRLWLAPNLR